VYGPGEADYRFIPTVIRCIKKNEPMKLAPGMHDWIYVEDLIDAIFAVQEGINDVKGLAVNIGTGTQYDNYDVVKHLAMLAKVDMNKLKIEHIKSLRSKDSWVADNSLLHRLGWVQQTSFIDGLTKLWK
jgi:nucleoside-diphosphate-sugar epimerase